MKKYWIRVILDNGTSSVLEHRNRREWTLKTAMRYAEEFYKQHGLICYIIEA